MPYASNADLPANVKKLSSRLQTAWRKAFNSAYSQYGSEDKAFATAWSTVNKMKEGSDFHPSFLRILDLFLSRYGEEVGSGKFSTFVMRNGLDVTRPYDPRAQFNESFKWLEPHIRFMKADKGARYYAIEALHAIISMNMNDYTDKDKMDRAAISMNYRPLNINHDHTRWLPYPRTRVEYAKAEDMCVELIIRVDNQDEYLQKQLDHDPSIPEKEWINHPSIEGRPLAGGKSEGYHFTALSLLEKGYQLPGDPLSEIYPIMFEGIQGGEVCLMVDGEKICLECESALKEGQNISENTGEINKGGAECPNCGHVVDLQDINLPSEVDCPNCGTAMKARPEKTVEASDGETVKTVEEVSKTMSEETPQILNTEEIETLKTHHETVLAKQREESSAEILKLQRDLESTKNKVRIRDDTIINLNERIAELEKASANYTGVQAEVVELTEKVAELKGDLASYKEKLATAQGDITAREAEVKTLNGKITRLEGLVETANSESAKWKRMHDNRSADISDALEKATLNSQKAINAIREKSEIQADNADLREQVAKLTKEYSVIAQKRHDDATKILALEKSNASLVEQVRKTEEANTAKLAEAQNTIKEAKKFHKWAWDKLKEAGYAIVE